MIKYIFKKFIKLLRIEEFNNQLYKNNILNSKILSNLNYQKKINNLAEVEWGVFSQFGEDGILNWLISFFPDMPKIFVEIGVGDYTECNTRLLLDGYGWSGHIFEGDSRSIDKIKKSKDLWKKNIDINKSFINKKNINELLKKRVKEKEIGVLSLDIDGNDFWVWKAIESIKPKIFICEYNSLFGDMLPLSIPYNKNFIRSNAHYSNQYFGASINAMIKLSESKGYTFIGTPSTGVNAFFIETKCANKILPYISVINKNRSQHDDSRNQLGVLRKTHYKNLISAMKDKKIINTLEEKEFTLNKYIDNYGLLYSKEWQI
jgi:hypothetical protein